MKRWREELPPNLDSDCLEIAPENLLETISDDHYDPVRQAAKRRRIEKIATEYLKGKVPFIASAKLRGPFDKGWRNPWTSEEKAAPVQTAGYNQDGIRTRSQIGERLSPENSRGIDSEPFSPEPEDVPMTQDDAPLSIPDARRDDSGPTEFFSLDADPSVTYDTSEHNPFWLRRHPSSGADFAQSRVGHVDPSPTRSRDGNQPIDGNGGVRLAPSKFPLGLSCSSPILPAVPSIPWKSSASESIAISSPVNALPVASRLTSAAKKTLSSQSSKGDQVNKKKDPLIPQPPPATPNPIPVPTTVQVPTTGLNTTALQCAQEPNNSTLPPQVDVGSTPLVPATDRVTHMPPPPSFTPINAGTLRSSQIATPTSSIIYLQNAPPSILEGHLAATQLALSAVQTAKAARSARRPSREDIQASAEKCDEVVRDPIAQPKSKRKKHTTKTPGPNLVASPALNASTGFMYRRVGEVASKAKSAKNSKPQAMAFDSSPAMLNTPKTGDAAPQVSQQELTLVGGGRARRDIYEVPEESSDGIEPQQSFRSGQQSNLSTQAAILRAHQDFQESTIPSATVETPRASLPSPDDTPQPDRSEPSVAFTAFSAFNAQLDKQHPPDSVIQDLQPVNTQDLFAAVSPFSFSTVKKKPSKSLGSSLRFAVFPSSGHNGHTEADIGVGHPTYSNRVPLKDSNARSPTPSDRMPLGDSNATLSFLGMASEKGSQESGELSFIQMTRQEVELPQLDFGNSLGNFEPNGDLNLTDRFLQQLHELR